MNHRVFLSVEEIFDERAETLIFGRGFLPYVTAGYKQGVENVKLREKRDDFSAYAKEQLRKKSFAHAALAVGSTKDTLRDLLQDALDEGWGVEELGRNVRKTFDIASRVRGLRIARTELTDAINDGSNATLRSEGYREKEWSTVIDGQERPDHNRANGQVVAVEQSFTVGGEQARYPGDERLTPGNRINCRCLIVAAGLPEDRKRQVGLRFLRAHGALERSFVVHLRHLFRGQRDRVLSRLAP